MEIVFIIIGIVVGIIIGYLFEKSHSGKDVARIQALESMNAQHEQVLKETKNQYERQLESQKALFLNQLDDQRDQYVSQLDEQKDMFTSQLETQKQQYAHQLEELKKQQAEQLEQQMTLLKEQVNTASEKILIERSEQLSEKNSEQLSVILNPLKEGIRQMRETVEKTSKDHADTMIRLDEQIKTSIKQSREVGERADKLAQALTGENKTQGNFGELRLKQLLEDMGLEEGTQFEEQATMRDGSGHAIYDDEDGHRMIPDVILHFPDKRDVIIDSKMSFKAFEDYHNADNDVERQDALNRHIASVRQHVNELARKNYSSYIRDGHAKLDFVMMYVFSESALQLALTNDTSLWKEAYDKGVIICGSQTLYMMLRVLEMSWRQLRQIENQEEMMKAADLVVNRVQLFYERFQNVESQLEKTRTAFDEIKTISAPTGQSIEVAARKLLSFGAKENPKRKYTLKSTDNEQPALESEEM